MMYWLSELNLAKSLKFFFVTVCIGLLPMLAWTQSAAHSSLPQPVLPNSHIELPPLPDNLPDSEDKYGGYVFAYPFSVSISKNDVQPLLKGDSLYYQLLIHSEGAFSLNAIFENVVIPPGATLRVFGKNDNFSYTSQDIYYNILATPLVEGDSICVEYVEPCDADIKGTWVIKQVSHDYKNITQKSGYLKSTSAECNVDVNCEVGNNWKVEKRAVCKMIIQGTTVCTGTLMNNTSKDNTPYVLTANHCVASETKAIRSVFYFDYENEVCGDMSSEKKAKTLSGATLVATSPNAKIDFSLLKLNTTPPKSYNPYYAGWSISEDIEKGVVCIHHPKGDVKKISIDESKPVSASFKATGTNYLNDAHWNVQSWEVGTTEGGSSGSPLFNSSHAVIGTLSGGQASCASPVNDFFSKFSKAWNYHEVSNARLNDWLDPLNLGVKSCPGYDPYLFASNELTNVWIEDTLNLFSFGDKADGLWSGLNEIGWRQFAEKFITKKYVYDITIAGLVDTSSSLSDARIIVWDGTDKPENELYSIILNKSMLKGSNCVYVHLDTPIKSDKIIWVGYEIQNNSSAIAVYQTKNESDGSFYVKHPKGWVNTQMLGLPSHLAVKLHVTDNPDTLSSYHFEAPFPSNYINIPISNLPTKELFTVDSIGNITNNTEFMNVSTSTIPNWAASGDVQSNCFSNRYVITEPVVLRSIKVAVAGVPDENLCTNFVVWSDKMETELTRKTVANNLLQKKHWNQIYLDSLLELSEPFNIGLCFDTISNKNLVPYMYYDVESNVDSYFTYDDNVCAYADLHIPYNIAFQPILARTKYHFNRDSARILSYPLKRINAIRLQDDKCFVLYPSLCTTYVCIRFFQNLCTEVQYCFADVDGNLTNWKSVQMHDGVFVVPVDYLSSGIYTMKIKTNDATFSGKFIHLGRK